MVDCRSLIDFCKAFQQHKHMASNRSIQPLSSRKRAKSLNPLSHPFCEHSPFAAIDIVILLLALVALGVLTLPYLKFIFQEALQLLPLTLDLIVEVICLAPVAYATGMVLAFVSAVAIWEVIDHKARKCGDPNCKGLKKVVEFDIQLESEDSLKHLPSLTEEGLGFHQLELGEDHKELEAELKKMAPPNGRTVLIFWAPCGCPSGRMEVRGHKKVRKMKRYL